MSSHAPPNPPVGDVGLLSFTHTRLWAAQKLVVNLLWYYSEEFVQLYLPFFSILSLFIIGAASLRRTRTLKAGVIVSSLYRIYVTLVLSLQKKTPGILLYADLPTFLLVFLPELLILDWRLGAPLYAFAFSHAGVCALLYTMTGMHGILMSICRAFGFHGVCFFVFLAIRQKAHSYCTRASEGSAASAPPKANKQLQMDADDVQQHKLHQKLQHEQQQQEHRPTWNPTKAQQPEHMQRETAERPPVEQTSDAAEVKAAAFEPHLLVSSSIDSPQNASRFVKVHQGVPRPRLHPTAPASTLVPKAVADALRAKTEAFPQSPYVSKLSQRHRPLRTAHHLQAACRLAVKIHGPTPDNVPRGALTNIHGRLQRCQCLSAGSPSMRAGCLVIGFDAVTCGQDTLQQLRDSVLPVASKWAREYGLLPPGEDGLLTVQACCQSTWGSTSANLGLNCPTGCSIMLHQPFLETIPSSLDHGASCKADLTLIAPPHLELRGWQGPADAPEDLPAEDGVKSRSLCCLASLDGQYLKVSVERCSRDSDGKWSAQVQVSLPETMDDTAYFKVLVLELWAAGKLACSYAAVIVPSFYAGALMELPNADEAGREQEESSEFVHDLVMWMHFFIQATGTSGATEGRQHALTDTFTEDSDGHADKEELMMAVDLLRYCREQGMQMLAGMLENTLAVFGTPPFDLLCAQTPAADQPDDDAPACQRDVSLHGPPSVDAGHSLSTAEQPEVAQRLQDAPCHCKDSPPSSSDPVQQPMTSGGGAAAGGAAPGAPSSSASCPNPPSQPSSYTSSAPASPPDAATLARGKRALKNVFSRFSPMTAPAEEEKYQAWKHVQIAHISSCWCLIQLLCWVVMVIRSILQGEQGWVSISAELGLLVSAVPTFAVAALFLSKAGSHQELIHLAIVIVRAGFVVVLGMGVVSVPSMLLPLLSSRVEVPGEIFMNAVAEQPRVFWMLPLRLVHTVGYGLWYSKYGVAAPWSQAIALNACALAVSLVMDARYRRSFALTQSNAKHGKADGGDLLCNEVPGCRQSGEEPLLFKAGSSTAPKCKQV